MDTNSLIGRAHQNIDEHFMVDFLKNMICIDSPSGHERELAEYVNMCLQDAGISSSYQPLNQNRGNVVGTIHGQSNHPTLLLTTHLDTFYSHEQEITEFGLDPDRPDLSLNPIVDDGFVIGRGAENAKGYIAAIVGAMSAINKADIQLEGRVVTALVSGGIIAGAPRHTPANVAAGVGTEHYLRYGIRPDYAIVCKGGPKLSWESSGTCWVELTITGDHVYSGHPQKNKFNNSIVHAAMLVNELHQLFNQGVIRGNITGIESGIAHKAAVTSAICDVYIDLSVQPGQDPIQVKRILDSEIRRFQQKYAEVEVTSKLLLSIPPSSTADFNEIVQTGIRTLEHETGRHFEKESHSHLNDSYVLRQWGIPTIQVGMQRSQYSKESRGLNHGICEISSLIELAKLYTSLMINMCSDTKS